MNEFLITSLKIQCPHCMEFIQVKDRPFMSLAELKRAKFLVLENHIKICPAAKSKSIPHLD